MIDQAKFDGQNFVNAFAKYHAIDPAVSMTLLISSFVGCYSMLEPVDRIHTTTVLLEVLKEIGMERFEDGPDFVDFMKQMITDKKEPE